MTKCCVENCENNVFSNFNKCALHCEKDDYQTDFRSGLLQEFYDLLNGYVIEYLLMSHPAFNSNSIILNTITNIYNTRASLHQYESVRNIAKDEEIIFSNIVFPMRKPQDRFDYFNTIKLFKGIYFKGCEFYLTSFNIGENEVFFEFCHFKRYIDFSPMKLLLNETGAIFSSCHFESNCVISARPNKCEFDSHIFSGAYFKGKLELQGLLLKKEIISNYDESVLILNDFYINTCIFEEKLKLNEHLFKNLIIKDSLFKSKCEIKWSVLEEIHIDNCNFKSIFDCYESQFKIFKIEKATFEEFALFEKVKFGLKNNVIESDENGNVIKDYQAKFRHVTFKNNLVFRKAKFYSGIDIENINLSTDIQPNFLQTQIFSLNTNRESYRIIKKSFDETGNHIEANKYFTEEMNAYRRELKWNKNDFFTKLIVNINWIISNFGQSYVRPILILGVFVFLYSLIKHFQSEIYSFTATNIYSSFPILEKTSRWFNEGAKSFIPFLSFTENNSGLEFISLIFYIIFSVLIWQTVIAIKRKVIRE